MTYTFRALKAILGVFMFIAFSNCISFGQRIVGYFPNYNYTSTNYQNIQYGKLTHLNYFALNPKRTTTGQTDGSLWTADPYSWFNTTNFNNVKTKARTVNPNIKIFITTGGSPGSDSDLNTRLTYIGNNPAILNTFCNNIINFIKTNSLDGWDLDWEFPSTASARTAHQNLLAKMRTKFDSVNLADCKKYEISIAVGGGYTDPTHTCYSPADTDYLNCAVISSVDFFNVMSYDGDIDPADGNGCYSSSHEDFNFVFQRSFNNWVSKCAVPSSKFVMGLGFYDNAGNDFSSGGNNSTNYNMTTWNGGSGCPDMQRKISWIKTQGGAGVLIWELTQDNLCSGTTPGCYSLLDCIYQYTITNWGTWTPPSSSCSPPVANYTASSTSVCAGQTVIFTDASTNSPTSWSWNFGTGATPATATTKGPHTVTYSIAGTATVSLTATNGSGTNTKTNANYITINPLPGAAGAIAGTSSQCAGATGKVYSISAVANATGYNWTVPTGSTITAGANTTSITVTMGTTNGNITVTPFNSCGNGTSSSLPLTINNIPSNPGVITGTALVCSNQTGVIYSIASVAGATGYAWTVPSGSTVTSGSGTNSITVAFGSSAGNVTVTPNNSCGSSASSSSIAVGITSGAGNAGTITGPSMPCASSTGNIYSIASVTGASGYNWSLPTGATITSGANTNTVTVTFGTTGGTISVTPTSGCGNGASASLAVAVNNAPSAAGTITGTSPLCSGASAVYSIASVTGATSYNWTVPTGATISSGSGTNSITIAFGSSSGNVTVAAVNSCGTGTASSSAITVNPTVTPSVSIVASSNPLCAGSAVTFTATPTNGGTSPSYQWKVNGVNAGTNIPTFTTSTINNNDIVTVVMTSNANCAAPTTATSNSITMNVVLAMGPSVSIAATQTTICSGTSVTFTATPTNAGASPTYQWKKNGLNVGTGGTTYTSNALANSDVISVTITTSASNCPANSSANSNTIIMTVNPTVTPSVTVATTQTTICAGTSVTFTATPTNGGTTPAYQWKKNGTNVGTNSATFTTSTIANGDVITVILTSNAACASPLTATSTGTTMAVNSTVTPSVTVAATQTTICSGTSVTFTATPTNGGTSPAYQWKKNGTNVGTNSATFTTSTIANGDVITVILTSNAACASPLTGTSLGTTMTVNSTVTPSVAVAATQTTICAGTSVTFTATPTNGGTTPAYQWKKNGTNVGTNSATFTTSTIANGDVITVILTSNAACASPLTGTSTGTTMTVNSTVVPSVTVAATQTTICSGTSVTFTATPTNGGTTPAYQWKKNGTNIGANSATFTTSTIANGDVITVVLTSNAACASPLTATSAGTTMTVNSTVTPSVTVAATQTTICAGTSVTFTATPTNGGTTPAYQWKVNGVNTGTNSAAFTSSALANNDIVTVVLSSNAICASPSIVTSNNTVMTVNSVPIAPSGFVNAPSPVTQGQNGIAYTVASVTGATSYTWSYSGTGVTINANGNPSVTLDFSSSSTSGVISVNASNGCGSSSMITKSITVNSSGTPNPGPMITYTNPVNAGTSGITYCVTNVIGTTYAWTFDGSGVVISGNGSSCITMNYSEFATSGTLSVVANNGNGPSTPTSLDVIVQSTTGVSVSLEGVSLKAYPNPFEHTSTIQIELTLGAMMDIYVYDVYGVKVKSIIVQEYMGAGTHEVDIDGIVNGVYFVKLKVGEKEKTIKLIKQ